MTLFAQRTVSIGTQKQKQSTKNKQKAVLAHKALVSLAIEQAPGTIQRTMEDLAQRGELDTGLPPGCDDEQLLEGEEDFDAEISTADEDDLDDGDSPRPGLDDLQDEDFAACPSFEIKVVIGKDGHVSCMPPENEWAMARAAESSQGHLMLGALQGLFHTFQAIAEWLEQDENAWLKDGARAFLEKHTQITQKEFASRHGIREDAFSRHIRNACLSWEDESIPLRELFA